MERRFSLIIRGQYPFDTLLELRINEGEAGNKDGTDYYREIAVELRDADNDEIYEIVAMIRRQGSILQIQQITSQPEIYKASFSNLPLTVLILPQEESS